MYALEYTINMQPGVGVPPVVNVSQGDIDREIVFTVMDGLNPYEFTGNETCVITGTKPSGLGFTVQGTVSESTITFYAGEEMTQEAGAIRTELVITDSVQEFRIGSANFNLVVEPTTHASSVIDGTTEDVPTVLQRCEQYANDAEASAQQAAQSATAAASAGAQAGEEAAESVVEDYYDSIMNNIVSNAYAPVDSAPFVEGMGYDYTGISVGSTMPATPSSAAGWKSCQYECQAGDAFIVTALGGSNMRTWGFTDKNRKLLSVAASNAPALNNSRLYAQSDGYLYINCASSFENPQVIHKRSFSDAYPDIMDAIEVTDDELDGLKEDLSSETESVYNALTYAEALNIPVIWEYGTINASGSEVYEDRKYYARTTDYIVFEKDVILNARYISNASSNLIVLTFDSSGTMTSRTLYYRNSDISALALTANTRYRFVYMASSSTVINLNKMSDYITLRTSTLIESMSELLSMVASAVDYDNDVVVSVPVTPTLGYMSTTGATVTNNAYVYTNKISVSEGDVLRMIAKKNGGSSIIRYATAFANGSAVSASGATNVQSYTVPNGIDEVVLTGYTGTDGDATTIPYVFKFTKGTVAKINDGNGFVIKSDTLDDADSIFIPLNNISKNTVLSFDAKVTSFSALEFGRTGYEDVIRITDLNVIILDKNGNTVSTTAHGLTIANTISIRLQRTVLDNIDIIVSSNGVIASTITKGWTKPSNGKPYVTSDGSTLADCALSYAPMDINKKTWVFGDSYCSITFNRWMGQLSIAGFLNNIMLNAYAGESAAQNIPALMNLIDKGNAQCIVWANGMNDGSDTDSLVSTMWLSAVNVFITACQSRGIIPVLCTIPTVPSINNEKKNAWVRSSGHRYIDFAKAVGANASGEWYSGMLSNDAVHPTEQGAIALFNRAVADCPELMEY